MNPEEQINYLEAANALAQGVDQLRRNLVELGWSKKGAEQAAISLMTQILAARSS
jgi:hypothetical protein